MRCPHSSSTSHLQVLTPMDRVAIITDPCEEIQIRMVHPCTNNPLPFRRMLFFHRPANHNNNNNEDQFLDRILVHRIVLQLPYNNNNNKADGSSR